MPINAFVEIPFVHSVTLLFAHSEEFRTRYIYLMATRCILTIEGKTFTAITGPFTYLLNTYHIQRSRAIEPLFNVPVISLSLNNSQIVFVAFSTRLRPQRPHKIVYHDASQYHAQILIYLHTI